MNEESQKKSSGPSVSASAKQARDCGDAKLPDANPRLQSMSIANEVATWTWDIVSDRVVADENLARIFGVSPEDAAGGPIEKYIQAIHPEDRHRVVAAIEKALENPEERFETDYRVVRSDGSTSWVIARGNVERTPDGSPKAFPGVVIDISSRKVSEQKADDLRFRLDQQLRIIDITLSSISDFAYIFDRHGCFVFVNQALLDLWGLKLEEAVGKNFYQLKYPDDLAARLQKQIQQVFDTKEGLRDETSYTSQTGAGGYYEYIFRPVFDRDGNVEFVAGSTRDITDRKRMEEELRESKERFKTLAETLEYKVEARTTELEARNREVLRQSDKLRELSVRLMETQDEERRRIAREMHDSAGQTIAALTMSLDCVLRQLKAANHELAPVVQEARKYAEELTREIRTTSYLLHPPMLDEIGLSAALGWYVDGLRQRSSLEVTLDIADPFERPSREMELAIFRIVQECLTNIHRHSGSKSAHIRVARENASIVVEVRDSGRGISAEDLAGVHTTGAGVGLRGMRERVRPFAGDVQIQSEVGVGTKVLVTFLQERTE